MTLYIKDNIVALATPRGFGALAVIRVSGNDLLSLFSQLTSIKKPTPRYAYFNKIKSHKKKIIDNVVIIFFKGPKSFTGEDVIEISCHGGNVIVDLLLEELLLSGCRNALPGEFSKRAYLNGKIDLIQAESINSIIKSSHPSQAQRGLMSFEGATKNAINDIKDLLYSLLMTLEHELDFIEDEISYTKKSHIKNKLKISTNKLDKLITGGVAINKINIGLRACIVGKPNAGKSTLFNTLIGYKKAIVSPQKGTTRDFLEAQIQIEGIPFLLIDTAGCWGGGNKLDKLGVEKTKKEIKKSDVIIILDEKNPLLVAKKLNIKKKPLIYVVSKSDLISIKNPNKNFIYISAINSQGVDMLLTTLSTLVFNTFIPENSYIVSNRQVVLLKKAFKGLRGLELNLKNIDVVQSASLLRLAIEDLEEIIGTTTSNDFLNMIFNDFCIGK